jgi:hypothetical protein
MAEDRLAELLSDFTAEERRRLWGADEIARPILNVSRSMLGRLVSSGRLASIKFDGKDRRGGRGRAGSIKFRLADVLRFIVEHEVAADRPASELVGRKAIDRDLVRAASR